LDERIKKKVTRRAGDRIRSQFRDEPLSKPGTRLLFDEKKPSGKLKDVAARPGHETLLAARRQTRKDGADNSGVEAAQFTERSAERAGGAVSTAVRKQAQKNRIKRQYAKAFRAGDLSGAKKTAATAKRAAAKAKEAAKKTAAFVRRNWKPIGIILAVVGIFALCFAAFSSCGAMLQGGAQSIIATSYTSEDSDIVQTDNNYSSLESALSTRIANIESEYPGYDEYRYDLDEIGHDPYELASYLTAVYQTYTPSMVQSELERLFGQQYKLTLTPVTETRYRTETRTGSYDTTDPVTGVVTTHYYTYTVEVPYSYYILNVKLENKSFGAVARANMTAEQAEMYAVYMETKGNKPELFANNPSVNQGEYTDYDIPPEALTDARFAAMIAEAEKYLGYPYVWGGSSPSTSFDCSGYVSWVVNHSGWSFGRLTANGLKDKCAIIPKSEAKPGDLIFFQGTYNTSGASHVGIYVGGGMMIHCGNPISYTSIETAYWQNHFYCYGRLP
jgi:ElaB/YqjD/DUF883 family membrane-anchored ribosome-binding protein